MNINSLPGAVIKNISYDPNAPRSSEDVGETEFSEALNETDENGVPKRWTNAKLYTMAMGSQNGYTVDVSALTKVREALKAEGVDADSRTPAHEITDEQLEWLRSRYDFERLKDCGIEDPEYGSFMLDLAYLNVFSFDEVENMFGVIPFYSDYQVISVYNPADGSYADPLGIEESVDEDGLNVRNIVLHLKATDPGHADEEYMKKAEDIFAQSRKRLEILDFILSGKTTVPEDNAELPDNEADESSVEKLERTKIPDDIFARFAERMANAANSAFFDINDALEKLKEDFGARADG
ncbi:MAG: hypothetical protein K2N38_04385 [Oscillospiraceae bacterium]|nr:hypothetical protein [Oscillospiraceae bacterium]